MREPYLAPAAGLPAPFVRLFQAIWDSRADLQRLFPLTAMLGRLRFLRWLIAGGLAEYGVEFTALPPRVRDHPMMKLAALSLRSRGAATPAATPVWAPGLVVGEGAVPPTGWLAFDPGLGRFAGAQGQVTGPVRVETVCFLGAPGLIGADAIALHAHGVQWRRAFAAWSPATAAQLTADSIALGFVDEVWTSGPAAADLPRPVRALDPKDPVEAALASQVLAAPAT